MRLILTFITSVILFYILLKLVSFIKFYIQGRRSGFPLYISPIPSKSPAWMVLGPVLQPVLKRYLPTSIYERLDYVIHGWEFRGRAEVHRRLSKKFVLVTPDECTLWIADPSLGQAVLRRRKEFIQAPVVGVVLGMFGSSVVQSNGENWQRQRRMIAPNLNERISQAVWDESCEQAQSMIEYLCNHPGTQTLSAVRCLALNVIGRSGYGQHQSWAPEIQDLANDGRSPRALYFKTLTLVADMLLEAAFIPTWLLKMPFMSSELQSLGYHKEKMASYTKEVLEEERQITKKEGAPRNNFLSMLVQVSDQEKSAGLSGLTLSDDEISGNLFVFSTAGFDTTANTTGYAIINLAAYPEWQEWVHEEIRDLDPDVSQWKYEVIFPHCPRILALMFETLRLYTPVPHALRHTIEPQRIVDGDGTHVLAAPMDVYVSAQIIHCDPEIYGADAIEFNPSRWIGSSGHVITPNSATFLPWSSGPRVCPGMKMAQVEFVATIATLFRSARCEPLRKGQENMEDLRQNLRDVMGRSISKLTLQVRDARQVKLRWVRDASSGTAQCGR